MPRLRNSVKRLVGSLCAAGMAVLMPALAAEAGLPSAMVNIPPGAQASGIQFRCSVDQLPGMQEQMTRYIAELNIHPDLVTAFLDIPSGILRFTLATPPDDTSTLDFKDRPGFDIPAHTVTMPTRTGESRSVQTVSPKEIVLALIQHGRLTEFSGSACTIDALREHVGIRQNIVAWAEVLEWGWPDGGPAKWNRKYWQEGSQDPLHSLSLAVNDAFLNQAEYEIGCYAATKLVVIQGILDYYHRIRHDPAKASLVEARLLEDRNPLVDIEPGRMWSFEPDFDTNGLDRPGKIMRISYGIAPTNFVPGDWSYFLNTDPATYQRLGYEGSNPIYLGRNRFVDYYNDHNHFYTFDEKLNEVYQWRNHVFNRVRDKEKVVPLKDEDYARLRRSPDEGGLLTTLRTVPYFFGFEALPAIKRAAK